GRHHYNYRRNGRRWCTPMTNPTSMKTLTLALLIASAAFPQSDSGSVGGPVLGLVFDGDVRGIRPLLGVPGSSTLGQSLDPAASFADAVTAGDFALAVDTAGTAVLLSTNARRPLP